ncbi:hypothetical protein MA16_Dca006789 [Dendrobium catenatum]|uniref:Uncharacterized protein n=1 Tax=Dendrobium catenatum TaxID=906689 RepID=A0A2I0W953_9ASPA|nr:hypothetical protein MA16_Dca006789 [Dendrobium catenatum]
MKVILNKKRKLGEFKNVALTKKCSAIIERKLFKILDDPEIFSIPSTIGDKFFGGALCDLGFSINLMSLFIFKILDIREVQPTSITIQLADRSFT